MTTEKEEVTPWFPIETAPQGKKILLWWRTARNPATGGFVSDERGDGWLCDGDMVLPKNQSDCTHWMPLPTPPATPANAKGSK